MSTSQDVLDSFYTQVYNKLKVVNPTRQLGGIVLVQDWPLPNVAFETPYLLFQDARPVNAQRDGSQYSMLYEHFCQWTWLVKGTDLQTTDVGTNRGDRYRAHLQIVGDLKQAHYPGFCPKVTVSASATTGAITSTPVLDQMGKGQESVWWSRLRFPTRNDNQRSGLIYGAAPVEVYGFITTPLALL